MKPMPPTPATTPMPALERSLRWYIAVRLVAVTSVLLPFFLLQLARPDAFPAAATHYVMLLAGATFGATLIYIGALRLLRRYPVAQAYLQFAGDLLLITVLGAIIGCIVTAMYLPLYEVLSKIG